jgi:hypothetical protein
MITRIIIAVVIASFFAPAIAVRAAEHPEHPQGSTQPASGGRTEGPQGELKEVGKADISAGIKQHITSETKASTDKKFHVKYQSKDLALDLIKVHDDRVSNLGKGKYFACVDMKATDGKTYDIDFFLTGQPGDMKVTETAVHKIDGKPLYSWKEENGYWKKVKA